MKICNFGWVMLASLVGLAGCASTGNGPDDPWEGMNRKVFVFNDKLDRYALKPVAQGYQFVTPLPMRTGISNFFGNLEDLWIGTNNFLQGKPLDGAGDFGRFALNSTVGILGVFDIASEVGLEKHEEDFGQTLGRWGVGNGPYMVLPLFGSSTVRDTGGLVVDRVVYNPNSLLESVPARNGLTSLKLVNVRAQFLGAETTLEEAALDKYVFMRNFYLQRRRSQIYDGRPPREDYFSAAPGLELGPQGSASQPGASESAPVVAQALPRVDQE